MDGGAAARGGEDEEEDLEEGLVGGVEMGGGVRFSFVTQSSKHRRHLHHRPSLHHHHLRSAQNLKKIPNGNVNDGVSGMVIFRVLVSQLAPSSPPS